MTQITEDYVSYDIAKLLKEKGFDVYVRSFYEKDKYKTKEEFSTNNALWNYNISSFRYSAPTLQMAMKWLREKHLVICIVPLTFYCGETVSKWGYCIWADDNTEVDEESSPRLDSYEEACENAIKYCLENLI